MAQPHITAEPMDTEEEAGSVSIVGSLASRGDTAGYSPAEINWPGSPFVGLRPSGRDLKRVQKGRSGGSGGPSREPSSNLGLSKLPTRICTVMGQFHRTLAATRDAQHLAFSSFQRPTKPMWTISKHRRVGSSRESRSLEKN